MNDPFITQLFATHRDFSGFPDKQTVRAFADDLLKVLFPHVGGQSFLTEDQLRTYLQELKIDLQAMLRLICCLPDEQIAGQFFDQLPVVYAKLRRDAESIVQEDPAAEDADEVILTYPGFHAIAIYRLAHELYQLNVPYIPRVLTEYAHQQTGIDIHPGAQIGEYFCIDHGTGIVIGQTTVIGNHVKLYQGVTLGAVSVEKTLAHVKRHPTIEDYVVIYANATILGGDLTVGAHSVVGGNVWLTESVPAYSKVYHKSQIKVSRSQSEVEEFLEFYI